ncbi:hypothetical protein NUU61_009502 [Penicillium alfredii]|uniref:Uncharacterized protein n=1 Tax=Penicillium alfredii TaxID=1506179 RepID=A0A9W9EN59_9EURO|nr:uncharacterized protein NUU61_009502 [Penicillium alfredii]KAJ5084923.1 hypothetical protein NUU61_009502 [Penicillium alfredii]
MYGLTSLSLLSLMVLSVSATANVKKTTVGIETAQTSRGLHVSLDECHAVEEEEVFTVSIRKKCRVFTGPECTGRNTVLAPGDHSAKDPVPVEAIFCHSA